ncbi:hybrid sensor histidine kinase/response regulator [Paraburkholderia phymatum]|uniref:histidine kinase n=1 Tax=Paraburkholderia phymatum (strain DSM 17167 / CIP 108236 / LMG 21445 / STM815) TaxID=391038 RepID=B2JVR1_PARP8|nr:hybrid sensor histidine kinase/response regulator [Paraburkholderia phymatum]ACC75038.1 histidine kinase [Paraburkholderia phymatum STM815]
MEERILIVAPRGRDAEVVAQVLSRERMECVVCTNVGQLVATLPEGAACALIADEALDALALRSLDGWLSTQPPWSDFPFVLLVGNGKKGVPTAEGRRLEVLGNVMLIERPVSGEALVSAARSARRARRRQYQARAMIAERAAANLRLVNAARQKDEFLAMLAHELRNPLAPIRNAAEAIRTTDAVLPARVQWAREIIERQSRHLASLLEDLLDVSRITTGKITLKRNIIELGGVLAAAIDVAKLALDAHGHTLVVRAPDDSIYLDADATRLAQVFGNLLDNAVKYTLDGGRIEIDVTAEEGLVTVAVSDNGTGIAPEELPEIFELFSQSNRALDRAQGGLGIGLSVVRSLIGMHGGTVRAESAGLGLGTRIVVTLPTVDAPVQGSDRADDVEHGNTQILDVLVVDDNVDAASSLALLLELNGHRVRIAHDGLHALDACADAQPDAVLLDIGLPGMDGYEVAQRLRQMVTMSHATLIAITGYGQPEDIARARAAGFDHHLVKPVEPDTLALLFDDVRQSRATQLR